MPNIFILLVRLHFPGSNRGDCIYGAVMPSFDAETVWKLPVKDKKALYGKHRIAVGGPAPEGAEHDSGDSAYDCLTSPTFSSRYQNH